MATLHGWRLCPRCGERLDTRGAPARLDCPSCGFTAYASSKPTAGAIVEDGEGRILLARRAVEPYLGMWDIPGGFLEEAEHPLEGLRRELLEEAGLEVEPARFLGAFVDTYGGGAGAAATLNLYWTAHVVSGEPVAADDVAELRWFAQDELPRDDELAFTMLPRVLAAWREGRMSG